MLSLGAGSGGEADWRARGAPGRRGRGAGDGGGEGQPAAEPAIADQAAALPAGRLDPDPVRLRRRQRGDACRRRDDGGLGVDDRGFRFGDRFALLTTVELASMRLLGPAVSARARAMLGDYAAIPGAASVLRHRPETPMRGYHGGMTPAKCRIPLILR